MKSFLVVDEGDRLVIKKLEDELKKLQSMLDQFIEVKKKSIAANDLSRETIQTVRSIEDDH